MTERQFSQDAQPHYSAATRHFHNTRPSVYLKMGWRERLYVLGKLLFHTASRIPQGTLPEVAPDWRQFLKPDAKTRFIWFGHSTLLLNLAGKTVLIDPVFSTSAAPFPFRIKRFQPPVVPLESLPAIDLILLSHNHYDHLDKQTILFFRHKNTRFLAPLGVGDYLRAWGIEAERITELDWYQSHTLGASTFIAAPARHASGRTLYDHNRTLWCSWVLKTPDETLFYSGDSGYDTHFADIGARFGPFDVAFVENGQYNRRWPDSHMSPAQTIQAVRDLAPRTFVPIHWGMFTLSLHHWTEPVQHSYQLAQRYSIRYLSPSIGQVMDSATPPLSPPWWQTYVPEDAKPHASNAEASAQYSDGDMR